MSIPPFVTIFPESNLSGGVINQPVGGDVVADKGRVSGIALSRDGLIFVQRLRPIQSFGFASCAFAKRN